MKGGDLTMAEIKGLCSWLMRCFGLCFQLFKIDIPSGEKNVSCNSSDSYWDLQCLSLTSSSSSFLYLILSSSATNTSFCFASILPPSLLTHVLALCFCGKVPENSPPRLSKEWLAQAWFQRVQSMVTWLLICSKTEHSGREHMVQQSWRETESETKDGRWRREGSGEGRTEQGHSILFKHLPSATHFPQQGPHPEVSIASQQGHKLATFLHERWGLFHVEGVMLGNDVHPQMKGTFCHRHL